MRRIPRWTGLLLAVLFVLAAIGGPLWPLWRFPEHVALAEGPTGVLRLALPPATELRLVGGDAVRLRGPVTGAGWGARQVALEPLRVGRAQLELWLFGLIPFRRMAVDVLPPVQVVPGGHSIGVLVPDGGVRIVGFVPVGDRPAPAYAAGLAVGDVIVRVDGRPVASGAELAELVERAGSARRPVRIEVQRAGRVFDAVVQPVLDRERGRYVIGVAVREGTAGVGTLTFYEPSSRVFAALGHVIVDRDGRTPLDVRGGRIVPAAVVDVRKGRRGDPGEKVGRFEPDGAPRGTITRNTEYGIAGLLEALPDDGHPASPIPVGFLHEVREGPAQLITVVEGHRRERFDIVIERVLGHQRGGKNMVVRVTDPRLLAVTGGIVQGMSGSPILQGGRLVGAVTHVFVNDPTRGYAVSADWMVLASGLVERLQRTRLPRTGTVP